MESGEGFGTNRGLLNHNETGPILEGIEREQKEKQIFSYSWSERDEKKEVIGVRERSKKQTGE